MKYLLTAIACCLAVAGSTQTPYNPDGNSDNNIGTEDLLQLLTLYGEVFSPEILTADSIPYSYMGGSSFNTVQSRLDVLSYAYLFNGSPSFTGVVEGRDLSYRTFTKGGGANVQFVNCDLTGTTFLYGGFYGTTFENCYFKNYNPPQFLCVKAIDAAVNGSCEIEGSDYYQTDCFPNPWFGDWFPTYNVNWHCIGGIMEFEYWNE